MRSRTVVFSIFYDIEKWVQANVRRAERRGQYLLCGAFFG